MTWVALALASLWLGLAIRLLIWRLRAPALPNLPTLSIPESHDAATAILLPVRNEEENLDACVATLERQTDAVEIWIVDDGSTDSTAGRLARLAAANPRIRAMVARPLRAGWTGKVNALATALEGVATPWILLTDADTRHSSGLLARAHLALSGHTLDALSLAGTQLCDGLGENLLTPAVYAWLDYELGDWAPHARGEAPVAIANGQFFLARTAALRAIDGFDALVGKPLDDVALAAALRAGGFRVGFRRANGTLRVRMYRGWRETFRGWRRNLALILGAGARFPQALVALAAASAGLLLFCALTVRPVSAALLWLAGALASALVRRTAGNRALYGALFPFDLLALSATLVVAAVDRRHGRTSSWRGRPLGG